MPLRALIPGVLLIAAVTVAPNASADDPYRCSPTNAICNAGSRFMAAAARYLGVSDEVVATYADSAALPSGVNACVIGVSCDWWPSIAMGLAAANACGSDGEPELGPVCGIASYVEDPTPVVDASQLDVVTDWINQNPVSGLDVDLGRLTNVVLGVASPGGSDALIQYYVSVVMALNYVSVDVGPSTREYTFVSPTTGASGSVLVDPGVGDDSTLTEAQKQCAGYITWGVWLDYHKEGFSNDILLRSAGGVAEHRLVPGSSRRCPVITATVDGSIVISATSNAGSFIESKTKTSGLQSRSGSIRTDDRIQPKLVGAGPYYEWTTGAVDVEWDWSAGFPRPIFQIYRAPAGLFKAESSSWVTLSPSTQRFTETGTNKLHAKWLCKKDGANPEHCVKNPA
ncbi:MAG TPA: hypothetical protein VNA20_08170 [Frankiaceae bacterium]|nr:hypothetical protein [Frankiaceae bacterium]